MKFITMRYEGKKPYTDRTPNRTQWEPGDENPVSERDAKILRGYLEFKVVVPAAPKKAAAKTEKTEPDTRGAGDGNANTGKGDGAGTGAGAEDDPQAAALALAKQREVELQERQKKAKRATEGELLEVSRMSKDALAAYAKQTYGLDLDLKAKVGDLRNQVTALAQGGAA
ncbi:hypothetical protein ASF19_20115 [Acidovorax sp. Leaf84]|uniref:hypothetical protein n=1 Tax=Acidovorax sp. Leaf84 TaxID=1736240 RepID=UPI0006FE573E|nr:hypothetical protein [Acidovorax sp. Leaf84]KQO38082.1 hypothetical protein ASF19_20115 [Acidovorax sp. Leaf84]RYF54665.1 MAG: hypothetical protein EOO27_23095 [Comamonadaceae bacterium]